MHRPWLILSLALACLMGSTWPAIALTPTECINSQLHELLPVGSENRTRPDITNPLALRAGDKNLAIAPSQLEQVLKANEQDFTRVFGSETGLKGIQGIKTMISTLENRRSHILNLIDRFGEDYRPELIKTEKFISDFHNILNKLEKNEVEFVVFFDSLEPVKDVLAGGKVKNYFEAGHFSGSYTQDERLKMEASMLGIPPAEYSHSYPSSLRPKYGMIRLKGDHPTDALIRTAKAYGGHALIFDGAQYADRMTFSLGDSYDRLGPYARSNQNQPLDQKVNLPGWSFHFIPWMYHDLMGMFSVGAFDAQPAFTTPKLDLIPEFKSLEPSRQDKFGFWYFEGQIWGDLDRKGLKGYEYYPDGKGAGPPTPELLNLLKRQGVQIRDQPK